MIALFDNMSVFHNQNNVCLFNGRQTMGNNKTCSSFHQLIHRLLDLDLGSCRNGALYKEKTYVNGTFTLKLSINKENPNMDWIIGILLLAVKDLQNGFLAVGGQTSIGRGIFEANGPLTIDGEENKEDAYIASSIVKYKEMDYEH